MNEPRYTDVVALRARSLASFEQAAKRVLEANPAMRSVVLSVSQYFADEAGDAVHEHLSAFPTLEPEWPHRCTWEAPRADAPRCHVCDHTLGYGELDSNTEAVFAWSAFCSEWGGGEGDPSLVDPIAIARRGEGGAVELELVFELVRPWLDNDGVAQTREEESWDETPDPPKPEPLRAPWTEAERPLLEAVHAQPGEAGPRRVLVDHWLERDDVRGEFGALSFDEPPTAEARARRDELARLHGREWLGPLQPLVPLWGASFARGPFPSRVVVRFEEVEDAERLAGLEDWAVVESLRLWSNTQHFSSAMRGLTELTGVTEEGLFALQRSGLTAPIRTLGLAGPVPVPAAWSPTLSQVRTLLVEQAIGDLSRLAALPAWSALEQVEVWFGEVNNAESSAVAAYWDDPQAQAKRALDVLGPKLPAGATLTVGYLRLNGARAGVVAIRDSSGVRLERRRWSSEEELQRARSQLAGVAAAVVAPPAQPARVELGEPTKPPGLIKRLLSRFGL